MFYSKFSCDGHTNPKFAISGEFAEGCNNNYHYFHIKIALQLLIKSLIHVVYFNDQIKDLQNAHSKSSPTAGILIIV